MKRYPFTLTVSTPWQMNYDILDQWNNLRKDLDNLGLEYKLKGNMADRSPVKILFKTQADLNLYIMLGKLERKVYRARPAGSLLDDFETRYGYYKFVG